MTTGTGISVPLVSNFTWAVICLSLYAGAFNVEIFRAGIEAVPRETVEAAESLGYSRLKAYVFVILPLAFRISLPALNNNLVNLIKTTTIAYAIAVPEMLYVANQIWSDELNVPEMMNMLLIIYVVAGRGPRLGDGRAGSGRCASRATRRDTDRVTASRTDLPVLLPFRLGARSAVRPAVRAAWHGAGACRSASSSRSASATRTPRPACPASWRRIVKWTPLLARASCSTSRSASSPWRSAPRSACCSGWRRSRSAARCAALVVDDAVLPQLALAGAACSTACCCCPSRCRIGNTIVPLPGWLKATIGLSLPVMANVSELVRGAVRSIPSAQWEAAESLAFSRRQTLWMIILPQCVKRMLPPWMNLYAILTVGDAARLDRRRQRGDDADRRRARRRERAPSCSCRCISTCCCGSSLYCYPIARATVALERRFQVR